MIAGTVFNEPWDSTVLENLMDLANYGDCLEEPIAEEDALKRLSNMTITNDNHQISVNPAPITTSYAIIDLNNGPATPSDYANCTDANANFTHEHQYHNLHSSTPNGQMVDSCCKLVNFCYLLTFWDVFRPYSSCFIVCVQYMHSTYYTVCMYIL